MAEVDECPAVVRTAEHEALFLGALLAGDISVVSINGFRYASFPAPPAYRTRCGISELYCRNEVEVALLVSGRIDEWRTLACVGPSSQAHREALQGPIWLAHVER